jgi:hypothetical protein
MLEPKLNIKFYKLIYKIYFNLTKQYDTKIHETIATR